MITSYRIRTRFTVLFLMLVTAVGAVGLTDAEGGTRRFMKKLDPAAFAMAERLHERVSFDLSNATLNDLIATVSTRAGVPVTQAPEIATSPAQNARFTIKAENVPAHAVLMEALIPFELVAEPTATGVTITKGSPERMIMHAPHRGALEEDVIITEGEEGKRFKVKTVVKENHAPGEVNERVFIRKLDKEAAAFDKDGKLRRELTLKFRENDVTSEGKLTIEITK